MLVENHMTLQLPLSSFILNPIDIAQVWKRLERLWCRHPIPMHYKWPVCLLFLFRVSQGRLVRFPLLPEANRRRQSWMWNSGCYSCWDTQARCHIIPIFCRMAKPTLHCFNIPIKVVSCWCTYAQGTEYLLFSEGILYLTLCKSLWWSWLCQVLLSNDLPALGGMEGIVPAQHKQALLEELCTHKWKNGKSG